MSDRDPQRRSARHKRHSGPRPASDTQPHRGGQLGLIGLVTLLCATSCVAFYEKGPQYPLSLLPQWAQQTGGTAPRLQPANGETQSRPTAQTQHFIVRFDDEPLLDEVGKTFRGDEAAARETYQAWRADHPDLSSLNLVRASFSGELILSLAIEEGAPSAGEILERLQAMENLVYAEPDTVAFAGSED